MEVPVNKEAIIIIIRWPGNRETLYAYYYDVFVVAFIHKQDIVSPSLELWRRPNGGKEEEEEKEK